MARIAGADIPNEKRVEVALTYIYGIGPTSAKKILQATAVDPDTRVKALTESDITRLRETNRRALFRGRRSASRSCDEY